MSAHVLLNLINELRKIDKKNNNLGNSFGVGESLHGDSGRSDQRKKTMSRLKVVIGTVSKKNSARRV